MGTTESVNQTIDSLLSDWSKIVYLYILVHDFAEQFKNGTFQWINSPAKPISLFLFHPLDANFATIKSFSYTNLLIGYGPNKEVSVSVFWCIKSKEYKLIFNGGNTAINAHTIMREQLQAHLNKHHNLSQIVHIIHETYQPLSSIAKLPIIPQLGMPVRQPQSEFIWNNIAKFVGFCSARWIQCWHSVSYLNRRHCFVYRTSPCIAWKFDYVAVD